MAIISSTMTNLIGCTTALKSTSTSAANATVTWAIDLPAATVQSIDERTISSTITDSIGFTTVLKPTTPVQESVIRIDSTYSRSPLPIGAAAVQQIGKRLKLPVDPRTGSNAVAPSTTVSRSETMVHPKSTLTVRPTISNASVFNSAAAVQLIEKRWELPAGPFTLNVPNDGELVTVCSSDCSKHCSKSVSEPRQCLRYSKDIPRWGRTETPERGPLYESYACLVCLNLPALMTTPNHPEGGNSLREAQDLVNAIYSVSTSVGIPPQLPFAMAMQESQASVRPHSGDQGNSRGTFQVQIPGSVTCLDTPIDQCTTDQIHAMVSLGICGQWNCAPPYQRPGIVTYWQQYPTEIGFISRGYNSGSVYDHSDLTVVAGGTNSYSSDIANRMMGKVVGGFYSRTCCAKCDEGRNVLEVKTCGPVDGLMSDFCGDEKYSFHGQIG